MHKTIAIFVLLAALFSVTAALARGGQSSDDCTPGSHDPDCTEATKGK